MAQKALSHIVHLLLNLGLITLLISAAFILSNAAVE